MIHQHHYYTRLFSMLEPIYARLYILDPSQTHESMRFALVEDFLFMNNPIGLIEKFELPRDEMHVICQGPVNLELQVHRLSALLDQLGVLG